MKASDLPKKIKNIPMTSGVYLMKDAGEKVIYVGKAVSLRKRVQSYFRRQARLDPKTAALVKDIQDIEIIETASEAGALILEASLIKKYKPRYNIDLRDDKSYPLIEITGDKFPRISIERPQRKNATSVYYGPYVDVKLVREALTVIRKIFPFCACPCLPNKTCLDYHLGLCPGPCAGHISPEDYARTVKSIRLILEGKKDKLYKSLRQEMESLAGKQKYEQAGQVRDQLRAVGALYGGTKDINYFKEAEQLQRLLGLPRLPVRVEAFDISNIMGVQAVGSMVSFFNGKPDKKQYRKFRIKDVQGIDDYKMIAEIVRRRYSRLKREKKAFPDLVVIDGGRGQLSAAAKELKTLELDIPIISLAKRLEEIFLPRRRNSVRLPASSLGLKFLQRIRDEAHRFAITYHRLLRGKDFVKKGQRSS